MAGGNRSSFGSVSSQPDTSEPASIGRKQSRFGKTIQSIIGGKGSQGSSSDHDPASTSATSTTVPVGDSKPTNGADAKRSDLPVNGGHVQVAAASAEAVRSRLTSDASAKVERAAATTIAAATTAQVQQVQSTAVQQTVQQTVQAVTAVQETKQTVQASSTSQTTSSQQQLELQAYSKGELQKRSSFYHDSVLESSSLALEIHRFTLPSKFTSTIEDSLFAIQESQQKEREHMLRILKARLDQQERHERIYEEQLESLRREYEKLVRQLSAAASEITMLRIQLSSSDESRQEHSKLVSTVTTTITTVTTTITTVTTRIEQWIQEVARNKGQITISKKDLDQLLLDLSNTSSQMTQLQQDYSELSKESSSIRHRLDQTLVIVKERDDAIASFSAEVAQFKNASAIMTQQIAALREDNQKLRNDVSVYSTRTSELERNQETLRLEVKSKTASLAEKEKRIASLTADVSLLRQSDVEKTKLITTLRDDYTKLQKNSSSQITELQRRYGALSRDRDSIWKELHDSKTLVTKLKRIDATRTEELKVVQQEKEKLRHDFTSVSSQLATLQKRCDAQSQEIVALRTDLQIKVALLTEQEHSITTITTERDQARREVEVKEGVITTTRQEVEQLRQRVTVSLDERTKLKERFDLQLIEVEKLRQEIAQIKHLAKAPATGTSSDQHIAQYIAVALEEKEKLIVKLRQDLAVSTTRISELEKSQEIISSKLSSSTDELTVKTSRYEGTISSLTVQVNQLNVTCTEKTQQLAESLTRLRALELEVSTSSAQFTELKGRYESQSQEFTSVNKQLQIVTSSIQEKEHEISSLITERDREKALVVTKTEEITKLQQELTVSTSEVVKLEANWKAQSTEFTSLQTKLTTIVSSSEEHQRKVVVLTSEIEELKRVKALSDERITTITKQVEVLQQELTNSRSQVTKLQHDYEVQTMELESLRKGLQANGGEKGSTVSTAQVEEWKTLLAAKGEELVVARKEIEEIRHKFENVSSQFAHSKQDLAAQIKRSQLLDSTRMTELTAAHAEIERLRHQVTTLSTQYAQLKQEFTSKTEVWKKLESTKSTEYKATITELTSQVERWKRLQHTTEEERESASHELQRVQHDLEASSSQITELQKQSSTQSTQLKFFREQFSGIFESSLETEEWRSIQTKVMAEVKDYAAVIKLTTEVDDWMSARTKSLQAELERKNKENDELRTKLVALKEIYVAAPRIKQIFQSETIEMKKRYEEETVVLKKRYEEESIALKTALATSQSQLRGAQRGVATADTYSDETVVEMLKKLNTEVQQNATLIANGIAKDHQRSRTSKATKEQIAAASRFIGKALTDSLTTVTGNDVAVYLSIAFQAYFSYSLCRAIPSWTIEKGHNDFIEQIYEQLQKTESQPMSGRWRALTRAYISPTWMSNPIALAQQIVADLSVIVVVAGCAASTSAANSKLSTFKEKVLSIISTAGQFSEMVGKVVSADFAVIAPQPLQEFEATTMEKYVNGYNKAKGNTGAAAAGNNVLCSTQLGMTKLVQRDSRKETLSVVKAKVVLE